MAKKQRKSLQLNVHLREEARRTLDEIEEATGIKDQAIARALFHALTTHWEKNKKILIPFEITFGETHEFHATANGALAKIKK